MFVGVLVYRYANLYACLYSLLWMKSLLLCFRISFHLRWYFNDEIIIAKSISLSRLFSLLFDSAF